MKTVDETALELIEASAQIGGIVRSNSRYTYGLARMINQSGQSVDDLTVRQLRVLEREYNAVYNKIYAEVA